MKTATKGMYITVAVVVLLGMAYVWLSPSGTGTAVSAICANRAWVNTSSSVATSATQILTASQNNCPAFVKSDGNNDIHCFLEQLTAASSTAVTTAGLVIKPSSTFDSSLVFGPDGIDARGYNVNCIAKTGATAVSILRK